MKILVIAPDNPTLPGLNEEVQAISSNHVAILVVGTVRESDISEAIRRIGDCDVIWWITHGGSEGVELSNSVVLSINGVGQFVTASGARLCVLNSCSSEDAARQIVIGGVATIIYTISNLPDTEALRFGSLLAVELTETDDFQTAFDAARPAKGDYRILPAGVALRAMDVTISGKMEVLSGRVDKNTQDIYEAKVDGRAYRADLAALRASVDALRASDEKRDHPVSDPVQVIKWVAILSAILLIMLTMALILARSGWV